MHLRSDCVQLADWPYYIHDGKPTDTRSWPVQAQWQLHVYAPSALKSKYSVLRPQSIRGFRISGEENSYYFPHNIKQILFVFFFVKKGKF